MPERTRDAFLHRFGHLPLGALPPAWRVAAICLRCAHRGDVPVRYLIDSRQVHATTRLEELPGMLRCARCDGRHVRLTIEAPDEPAPGGAHGSAASPTVVPLRRRGGAP